VPEEALWVYDSDVDAYKAIKAGKRRLGAPLRLFITMPASYVRYRVARALVQNMVPGRVLPQALKRANYTMQHSSI
jgi:hypothetical protein